MADEEAPGNTEEDWRIYEVLCKDTEVSIEDANRQFRSSSVYSLGAMEADDVDVATSLRSDLAALQFKRERLAEDLKDMHCQLRSREQRCMELQVEADQLREQNARQNAVIISLKKRLSELEERERSLYAAQGRNEIAIQTLQRDNKYQDDRAKELDKKIRNLEMDLTTEEQKKETARNAFQDLVRRLSVALGTEPCESAHMSTESLVHKASELVQELSRLRNRNLTCNDTLATLEIELRTCRENLERTIADKECLQRQSASQLLDLDRLKQEKDAIELHQRVTERELLEVKDKLVASTRSLGSAGTNIAQQESTICQLKDEVRIREEKCQKIQHDHHKYLETVSGMLCTPGHFVETCETAIKDRIRELITENKDKCAQIEAMREKLAHDSAQLDRHVSMCEQANARIRALEEEKCHLESRLRKADAEINSCEMSREGLKRDKSTVAVTVRRFEIETVYLDRHGLSTSTQGANATGTATTEGSTFGFIAQKIGTTRGQHESEMPIAERTGRGYYACQEVNEASGQAPAATL
ncbi:tsec-2-related [Holotrichia oblita]|uniref:Tsec-2-related n=1 Tax=Holotrichia oblita TaxID=644536 RepID=A0ACB9TA58_HOLOL|nr:tsec-2-related [Holotrichia oblita]